MRRGVIVASGWHIRFVFGRKGQREYLDFYAQHRMTNDRHERIYDDGETVTLESLQEFCVYNPNIPGDKEHAQEAYDTHNRRVGALIDEKFAACVEHEEP